ncbi:PSD1 and planctomycete cytochrome C domain-containing protein [Verrucomicrobium spinosum]|uniref:PSD1 and planctomycete cytochrome C domain-containing protein n=1 Tax=Verrucomicrobium spinosum TaxID=2736 RepID=UPI00017455EC|nr:PSD1 and planctomycete cytochrome C domain-containing protein [Verrucomicrobium spinosum]
MAASLLGLVSTWADDTSIEGQVRFFEARIRPVLVEHCYECHSAEAGKAKGGLVVDTREGLLKGGEGGAAVVPGDLTRSRLLIAVKHLETDLEMPPKNPKLPAGVIADFENWIKHGAPDPRVGQVVGHHPSSIDLEQGRQFWSCQPPVIVPPPPVHDAAWARRPLDLYVRGKLEEAGMVPSADASPAIWLRRLHFDLVGLPPSPEGTAAFVAGWERSAVISAAALEAHLAATVDRLLASPQFGERWGRHWLDVARFAESNGRESNLTFPHAWRYRDYVIDAFNADLPYDRFLQEQIAGDLLPAADDAERARQLIATGFLAMGAKGLNEMSKAQFTADLVDEQVDTVTRAVLASSVACARCHDHKSDPYRMEDYYALVGIFRSTRTYYGTWIDSESNHGGELLRLPNLPGEVIPNKSLRSQEVANLKADLATLNREEEEQNAMVKRAMEEGRDISEDSFKLMQNAIRIYWSRGGIEGRLQTVDEEGRALPLCMGVTDVEPDKVQDAVLMERGDIGHPGQKVPRGVPAVFTGQGKVAPTMPARQSGRLELACWLGSRENPLTARVMVNRIWRQLFGIGLVRTVDNFGTTGELPSHPGLLDALAVQFMENGWSVKAVVREIVLSRTYRQSAGYRAQAYEQDPDNRLLWRMRSRRLDAEAIRDAMLAVSGNLDVSRRRGSLVAELDGQSVSLIGFNEKIPADLDGSRHRSVYLPVLRDQLPDALQTFDFAEPSLVTGDRDVTNNSLQALYLLNGRFVRGQAEGFASRLSRGVSSTEDRIRLAFRLCFTREPDAAEMRLARQYLETGMQTEVWTAFCQALLATAEFRIVE